MMTKIVIEETREICSLCGGRGYSPIRETYSTITTMSTCSQCSGSGQVLTKTVTRKEEFDTIELTKELIANIRDNVKGSNSEMKNALGLNIQYKIGFEDKI